MPETVVKAWECAICHYQWLKVAGRSPKQCANRQCRKRAWNKSINTVEDVVRLVKPKEPIQPYYQPNRGKR